MRPCCESAGLRITRIYKRLDVTEMSDDRLLNWYEPDPDKAKEEHQRHHRSLLVFVRRSGIRDAEGAVGEIFARLVAKLAAGQVPEVRSEEERGRFLGGYARNVCLEFLKDQKSNVVSLDETLGAGVLSQVHAIEAGVQANLEMSELRGSARTCFGRCMESLKPEDAEMLLEYYRGEEGAQIAIRKELAKRLGLTMNALALKVRDRRKTLRRCVEPCMEAKGLRIEDLKLLGYRLVD